MRLLVAHDDWGAAQPSEIEALLVDTASYLNAQMRCPFAGTICVVPASPNEPPRVLYRSSSDECYTVRLPARNRYWAQFAFQFSHEFCHILSGYDHLKNNPNNWFHETICELGAVFTLRCMASRWPTRPPYPHWAAYASSLVEYVTQLLSRPEVQLPAGVLLANWLAAREDELRINPLKRELNSVVAYILLPIFEAEPIGWNCIRRFPTSPKPMRDYLKLWHFVADDGDRAFICRVSDALGYKMAT
jgi:hypothetical protein